MASRHSCAHCGQSCGESGHLRLERPGETEICPSTLPLTATLERARRFGFCCPRGHTCRGDRAVDLTNTTPDRWRQQDATPRQLAYLRSLGYRGRDELTKGEAHDLLEQLVGRRGTQGAFALRSPDRQPRRARTRGIHLRK